MALQSLADMGEIDSLTTHGEFDKAFDKAKKTKSGMNMFQQSLRREHGMDLQQAALCVHPGLLLGKSGAEFKKVCFDYIKKHSTKKNKD